MAPACEVRRQHQNTCAKSQNQRDPDDQRQAVIKGVREANKTFVDVVFSNADHGFFCDARPSYNAAAAAQAWSLTLAFLNSYCPTR